MDNNTAILITYASMLIDGNPVTNLMSIGEKSPLTGPDPPKPANVGGLNTHAGFEGRCIRNFSVHNYLYKTL